MYIELGSTPCDEPCVQVTNKEDYFPAMKAECKRYVELLEKCFPNVPGWFRIKTFSHDFGLYCEAVYHYDESDEEDESWAYFIEGNCPNTWDDDYVYEKRKQPSNLLLDRIASLETNK